MKLNVEPPLVEARAVLSGGFRRVVRLLQVVRNCHPLIERGKGL